MNVGESAAAATGPAPAGAAAGGAAGGAAAAPGAGMSASALLEAIRAAHAANKAVIDGIQAQAAAGSQIVRKEYPVEFALKPLPAAGAAVAAAAGGAAVGGAAAAGGGDDVPEVGVLAVKEEDITTPVAEYLSEWSVASAAPGGTGLVPIHDLFKDKLSYAPAKWSDVIALNDGMLPVAAQVRSGVVCCSTAWL